MLQEAHEAEVNGGLIEANKDTPSAVDIIVIKGDGTDDKIAGVHECSIKEEHIEVEGRVQTVLPGTMFRVELPNKHVVLATICGKMRKRWVRLTIGDRVKMEMSPYDLDKARITWRLR